MASTSKGFGANLDNEDLMPAESTGGARITTAGIHDDLMYKGCSLDELESKNEKSKGKKFTYAEFIFENQAGEQYTYKMFAPPATPEDVTWQSDKYGPDPKNPKKRIKMGKLSNEQMHQILNNDVFYFLLDLGDALGIDPEKLKAKLGVAETFKELIELFIKYVKVDDNKRISMKLLWNNNDKNQSSFLELKGLLSYYPFKSDLFDVYQPGRKTLLWISEFEEKKLTRKYTSNEPKTGSGVSQGSTSGNTYTPPTGGPSVEDEDPF